VTGNNATRNGIDRIDVENGEVTPVLPEAALGQISADGRWLVFVHRDRRLLSRNLQNGEEKELDGPGGLPLVTLSRDGRFIYHSDLSPAGEKPNRLWRIPAEGGAAKDLRSAASWHERLSVHPNGTRVTFSTETISPEPAQLWAMENFLPAIKR